MNLIAGLAGVAKVALELDVTPDGVISEREAACQAPCEHYRPHPMFGANWATCGLCHCFVGVKVRVASQRCPDKPSRWLPVPAS